MRIFMSPAFLIVIQVVVSCLFTYPLSEAHTTNQGDGESVSTLKNDIRQEAVSAEAAQASTVLPDVTSPQNLNDQVADISQQDGGKVTEIHSSFDEVSPQKVTTETAVQDDGLPAVINQGTVSHDLPETESVGVVSLVDTATAELQQRVASLSASSQAGERSKTLTATNVSADTLSPVIILPASGTEHSQQGSDSAGKKTQVPSSKQAAVSEPAPPPPPVVRAEPKIVEPEHKIPEVRASSDRESGSKKDDVLTVDSQTPPDDLVDIAASSTPPSVSVGTTDGSGAATTDTPQEDIPSFSEWAQKQLEEAEKKKGQNKTLNPGTGRGPNQSKLRSKNYASPDCGAKVVATNPEAENPSGVLSSSKDEYLINKCSTQRMWVIIELCEAIQAKKLELANFELFSSSPRDFSVSLSHIYPSREWSSVGHFTARDERTVQSFNLHPHLFGKFVKVEFNTHYGREHFCCTSLIRVYGTSEFEVLETENEVHHPAPELEEEDEDEIPIGVDMGKPTTNLFGHATNAVYSIVKKAAEVLVKGSESQNHSSAIDEGNSTALIQTNQPPHRIHCNTLRHLIVCNNCSEQFFDRVYHLLSCHSRELQELISTPFVLDGINSSQLCSLYGLDFMMRHSSSIPLRLKHEDQLDQAGYLAAMLPPEYISALCNILAVLERKVVLNMSGDASPYKSVNITVAPQQDARDLGFKKLLIEPHVAQTCSLDPSFPSSQCQSQYPDSKIVSKMQVATSAPGRHPGMSDTPSVASQIKPTKTFSKSDPKVMSMQPSAESLSGISRERPVSDPVSESEEVTVASIQPSVDQGEQDVTSPDSSVPISTSEVNPNAIPDVQGPEQPVAEPPQVEQDLIDHADSLDVGNVDEHDQSKDLDALFLEMKSLDSEESTPESSQQSGNMASTSGNVVSPPTKAPSQQGQKESVFLRLSNKIKALERNMSLSGQYLEELSRRYKRQEELGRALNKTLGVLRDEIKRVREREQQHDADMNLHHSQISQLLAIVESLQSERESWQHKAAVISQHLVLIVIEVLMFAVVVWVCRRLPNEPDDNVAMSGPQRKWSTGLRKLSRFQHQRQQLQGRRRSSLEGLTPPQPRKRRPSEEALNISGSYQDLLLQEDNVVVVKGVDMSPASSDASSWLSVGSSRDQRRRRRRRKDMLTKSSSSCNLTRVPEDSPTGATRRISAPSRHASLSPQATMSDGTFTVSQKPGYTNLSGVDASYKKSISESAVTPNPTETGIEVTELQGNGGVRTTKYSLPPFIETAASARSRRSFSFGTTESSEQAAQDEKKNHEGDSGSNMSQQSSQSRTFDDGPLERTSSRSDTQIVVSSEVGEKKKKGGKRGGLKNMVKKFF